MAQLRQKAFTLEDHVQWEGRERGGGGGCKAMTTILQPLTCMAQAAHSGH